MMNKIIKICADPFPPYQFINADGSAAGSDWELISRIFRKIGYTPVVEIDFWEKIYPKFVDKEFDAIFQVQFSRERVKKFYLSDCFRQAETEVVTINKDYTSIDHYQMLSAYKVGVIAGFTNGPDIDQLPAFCKKEYSDAKEILDGLFKNEIAFGIIDKGVKNHLIQKSFADIIKETTIYKLEKLSYYRPMHVMFHNRSVCEHFNLQLRSLQTC